MTQDEMSKAHEKQLDELIARLGGDGESDWALVRALVHKAVHLAADRKAGEYCAVATLLAEMIQHAHDVMHPGTKSSGHTHQTMTH